MNKTIKPPSWPKPLSMVEKERIQVLKAAIRRYNIEGMDVPDELFVELEEMIAAQMD